MGVDGLEEGDIMLMSNNNWTGINFRILTKKVGDRFYHTDLSSLKAYKNGDAYKASMSYNNWACQVLKLQEQDRIVIEYLKEYEK